MLAIRPPKEIGRSPPESPGGQDRRTKTFYGKEAILKHLGDRGDMYLSINHLAIRRVGDRKDIYD